MRGRYRVGTAGNRRLRRRGLTLVEVVVASALLVAGLIPVLRALTLSHASRLQIERQSCSLILAQGVLARLRAELACDYAESVAVNSRSLPEGYLATVTDDGDAACRTLSVRVGFDVDGNRRLSDDEVCVTLTSAVARLNS